MSGPRFGDKHLLGLLGLSRTPYTYHLDAARTDWQAPAVSYLLNHQILQNEAKS